MTAASLKRAQSVRRPGGGGETRGTTAEGEALYASIVGHALKATGARMVALWGFNARTATVSNFALAATPPHLFARALAIARRAVPLFDRSRFTFSATVNPFVHAVFLEGRTMLDRFEAATHGVIDARVVTVVHNVLGVQHTLAVPLVVEGAVAGCLAFHFAHLPSRAERQTAEAFAEQAALAFQNEHLSKALRTEIAELESMRERFRALALERAATMEELPVGVVVLGASGRIASANEAARRITGIALDEGRVFVDVFREAGMDVWEDRPSEPGMVARALGGEPTLDRERIYHGPGESADRIVRTSLTPLRAAHGRSGGVVVVLADVTQERRLERELIATGQELRVAYGAMACGVIVRDAAGTIVQANEAVQRILGLPADGLIGLPSTGVALHRADGREIPPDERLSSVVQRTRRAIRDTQIWIRKPDGTRCWLHVDCVPVLDDHGEILHTVTSFLDVTEHKEATWALARRTLALEAVVDLGDRAIAGVPLRELFERATELMRRVLEVDLVEVSELVGEDRVIVRAGVGWPAGVVGQLTLPLEQSLSGWALRARGPVVVDELAADPRFSAAEWLRERGIVSGASVVIASDFGLIGGLAVHTLARRSFADSDVYFLEAVANVLGGAHRREGEKRRRVERARLRERLTARETEVLRFLTEGANNHAIAKQLGVGYTTVRAHVRAVIEKLEARSRLEAVARANACDLFRADEAPPHARPWPTPPLRGDGVMRKGRPPS